MEINHATSEDGAVWECRIDNAKAYTEVAVRAQPLAILPPLQQPLLEGTVGPRLLRRPGHVKYDAIFGVDAIIEG